MGQKHVARVLQSSARTARGCGRGRGTDCAQVGGGRFFFPFLWSRALSLVQGTVTLGQGGWDLLCLMKYKR